MNHRNEFVGVDAQGRKQTKRKPEHRHGNNHVKKVIAKKGK